LISVYLITFKSINLDIYSLSSEEIIQLLLSDVKL